MASAVRIRMKVADRAIEMLRNKLDAIAKGVGTKALVAGMNEVTKTVLATARSLVPVRTNRLKKVLGRKVKTYRGSKVVVGIVGPRKGMRVLINGVPIDPAKYAHLVEFGRGPVKAGSKKNRRSGKQNETGRKVLSNQKTAVGTSQVQVFGPAVGPAAPRPFLRPAWEQVKPTANAVLAKHLNAALTQLIGGGNLRAG